MKPTVLMVKKHNETGLLYFCKTTKLEEAETYPGSGKHWSNHLRKHGKNFSTIWKSEVFENKSKLTSFALLFSEQHNIVKSPYWANERPENGLDGKPPGTKSSIEERRKMSNAKSGCKLSEEHKANIGKSMKNRVFTEEHKAKISEAKTGKPLSEEHKETLSKSHSGKKLSEEHKAKIRANARTGEPWNKGTAYKQKTLVCPHCGKEGGSGGLKRYHFDNCKKKP